MEDTLSQYTTVAKEMAKGLRIPVEVQGDLDKITNVYNTQMKNAAQATQQMTQLQQQQQQVIANTTNTISRQLAEQEKLNKAQREAYTEQQRGLDIAKNVLGTHDQNIERMAKLNKELKNLKDAYKNQAIGAEEYTRRELELKTAKQELQKILNNETKMMQAAEGSYQRLSLQLERMKMAQKQLN
jgi:myosin heavy subunit